MDSLHGGQANSIGNGTFHEKEPHGNDVSVTMEVSSNGGVSQAQEVGSGSRGPQLKVYYIFIFVSHIQVEAKP